MSDRFAWLTEAPLEKAVAGLSEGRCPQCHQRVTPGPPFELDEEDNNPPEAAPFAQGGCVSCGLWMRAGHTGSNPDRDWFSVTMLNEGLQGILTLSLNPPDSGDDDYDPDDDYDWED